MKGSNFVAAMILTAAGVSGETLRLDPLFSAGAVLQAGKPLRITGNAPPEARVSVAFAGQEVTVITDPDGRFAAPLAPLAVETRPRALRAASGDDVVVSEDVVVGDLWVASGQSNMEFPVSRLIPEQQATAKAHRPLVRELRVKQTVAGFPLQLVPTAGWKSAHPQTVLEFSAVAYFFAEHVQRETGVPIGILHSSWGGTVIESWIGDDIRAGTTVARTIDERWQAAMAEWSPERIARYPEEKAAWEAADAKARETGTQNPLPWPPPPSTPDSPGRPGGLYNGMIAPLTRTPIRGILWYQGESNVGRATEYVELFRVLITSWREAWKQPALPFLFVQLPNHAGGDPLARNWSELREAQARALSLPGTAMAVAIDEGDVEDIHPTRKREVGRRLALLALNRVYGAPVEADGPVFARVQAEAGRLRVFFANPGIGLRLEGGDPTAFELAGEDRRFQPARAEVEGDTLLVSSPLVPNPVAVRYAFTNAPKATLFSASRLPAAPFRSDSW